MNEITTYQERTMAVDIVFCIDVTGSALFGYSILDTALNKINEIYSDLSKARKRKMKSKIDSFRVRIIAFGVVCSG